MLFNTLHFWIFFSLFFVLYFVTRGTLRLLLSLAGSYLFYGWWDVKFLLLIIFLTTVNFGCGIRIAKHHDNRKLQKRYVVLSVASSLIVLGFFKYFNFFFSEISHLMSLLGFQYTNSLSIILPVGISFYTFQTMSYTIDLYRSQIPVERSLLRFAVFVSFFPQLVAGPIVRAKDFLPQLSSDRKVVWEDIRSGFNMIVWGFVLKVVMADNLAVIADLAFAHIPSSSGLFLLIGLLFYTFQIYGDFAGYSLIAIGLARVLGFSFCENFNKPYLATSFSGFWKRWHISLSSWLKDYLYIPLGGNRKGRARTYLNLFLTMLLGGLWHGAAWTFVIWGGLHGLYLVVQRLVSKCFASFLPRGFETACAWVFVFAGVCIGWAFFRAQSFSDASLMLTKISTLSPFAVETIQRKFFVLKGGSIILFVALVEVFSLKVDYDGFASRYAVVNILFWVLSLCLISLFGMFGSNSFIYFQF